MAGSSEIEFKGAKTKAELLDQLVKMRRRISRLERVRDECRNLQQQLNERTVEYEKLAAIGRLTANVAHEIRNPITVIGGLARRMAKTVTADRKEKEYLDLIVMESKRLEDILRDAITFSDKGIFNRSECNINEVVEEAFRIYSNKCKQFCIVVQKSLGKVPKVFVDIRQVGEAIANIIQNAIDVLHKGGIVSVKTGRKMFNKRNYAVVQISDNGSGIPEDKIKLIFEPFFTTKLNKHETGLGLPIAKKVVEGHGGFIKVSSIVGKGTTFLLYFPYRAHSNKAL